MRRLLTLTGDRIWIAMPMILLASLIFIAGYQSGTDPTPADDIDDINEVLDNFEDSYSNERLNELRMLFFSEAVIAMDGEAGTSQHVIGLEDWLSATQENTFSMNEYISDTLSDREITVYRNIAYAVCNYTYIDDSEIGRGVDIFTFMKMRNRWRIVSLVFTGDEEVTD